MTELYRDAYISCTETGVDVRWYYLWGAKHIPYSHIRSAKIITLGPTRGKYRIWGTGNPRYWASLDPHRPRKEQGIILDLGAQVSPLLTPDNVPAFAQVLTDRLGPDVVQEAGPGPFV
jgi:hypothetical protein